MSKTIYYTTEYLQKNPTWHVEDSARKAEYVLDMIQRCNLKPRRICEVGCGVGEILNQLQAQMDEGIEFDGYDVSPHAIRLAKRREKGYVKFYNEDALEKSDTYYDLVLVVDVIEHVEDYWTFLRKVRLRGLYKLFHIPLDLNVLNLLNGKLMKKRVDVGHIHYFTKDTALDTLKSTGFEIICSCYTPVAIDAPSSLMSRALVLPRKIAFRLSQDFAACLFGGFSLIVLTK
jgi:SAM-dependent methyltransferase